MTAVLSPTWQMPSQVDSDNRPTERRKPSLRVIPVSTNNEQEAAPSPSKLATGLFSPRSLLSPTSPSDGSKSPSFKQKMHFRMRSISGKTPLTLAKKWERLSDKDKAASQKFVKDAVSMCGLAGFSWKKTHEYLELATDLPLHPDYLLNPDEAPLMDDEHSNSSSRRPSTSQLLTPDAASMLNVSRPSTSTPSTVSLSSSTSSITLDLKPVLTRIRLLFEEMQQRRDPIYMHYINLPHNNLKKMHGHAVAQHRIAVLRVERSSLMDAIDFDKKAEKSRNMEMAVAKLRFEMELDVEAALDDQTEGLADSAILAVREAENRDRLAAGVGAGSIHKSHSSSSFGSTFSQLTSAYRRTETSDMRREASANNRVSGVPTIVTTVSDMMPMHLRHTSIASSLDRPSSPESAKSDGHVQSRDTWKRLQEARHKLSRRSRSRVDGLPHPGPGQKLDGQGFFATRPAAEQ